MFYVFLGIAAALALGGMIVQFSWLKKKYEDRDDDEIIYRLA